MFLDLQCCCPSTSMLPQVQQLGAGLPPQMLPLLMQMQVPALATLRPRAAAMLCSVEGPALATCRNGAAQAAAAQPVNPEPELALIVVVMQGLGGAGGHPGGLPPGFPVNHHMLMPPGMPHPLASLQSQLQSYALFQVLGPAPFHSAGEKKSSLVQQCCAPLPYLTLNLERSLQAS